MANFSAWNKPLVQKEDLQNGFPVLSAPDGSIGTNNGQNEAQDAGGPDAEGKYREMQKDEVEALKAIYYDGYEDFDSQDGAWNKFADFSFKLRLRSRIDQETAVNLLVRLTATYPKTVPIISLEGLEFLKARFRNEIEAVVKYNPPALLGQEMIHLLAEAIEDVLDRAVEDAAANELAPTLDEERAMQQEKALVAAKFLEETQTKQQAEHEEKEQFVLGKMLSAEIEKRNEAHVRGDRNSETQKYQALEQSHLVARSKRLEDVETAERTKTLIDLDRTVKIKDYNGNSLVFKRIYGMVQVGKGPTTTVHHAHPVSEGNILIDSILLVVKHAKFSCPSAVGLRTFQESIQQMEKEMDQLLAMKGQHPNVLDVLDYRIDVDHETQSWEVFILQQQAELGSLRQYLTISNLSGTKHKASGRSHIDKDDNDHSSGEKESASQHHQPVPRFRLRIIELLEALDFIHRHGLHNSIHAGNVLFFDAKEGRPQLKLADGTTQHWLRYLKNFGNNEMAASDPTVPAAWLPPEFTRSEEGNLSSKSDIWFFGIVVLQMLFGLEVIKIHASPTDFLERMHLSEPVTDFIRKVFRTDPSRRPHAFRLLAEDFVRDDYPLLALYSPSRSRLSSYAVSSPQPPRMRKESSLAVPSLSRYSNDFDELGRLGKGGYGIVLKARNKLDGQIYAVKKVTQSSAGSLPVVLSETMHLSKLSHPNVVRYFTAWIEEDLSSMNSDSDSDVISSAENSNESQDSEPIFDFGHTSRGLDIVSSTHPLVEFGYDSGSDMGSEADENNEGTEESSSLKPGSGSQLQAQRTRSSNRSSRQNRRILYIQMEYCEKHTLRDLIKGGLFKNNDEIWRLLRQIVEGLHHIHGHKMIHRDLKPENIFLDAANLPRIGDFGLATSGRSSETERSDSSKVHPSGDLTRSVGTTFYVAPELRSTTKGSYSDKVDMYSLGIILFEMCHDLPTYMERSQVLLKLREKHHTLPQSFEKGEKAKLGEIILSLVDHEPGLRPTSENLLMSDKLPLPNETDTMRQAFQDLSDIKSLTGQKMIKILFSRDNDQVKDYAWDIDIPPKISTNDLFLQQLVKHELCSIFRRHGAIETVRAPLHPRSQHYQTKEFPNLPVHVMDISGLSLQMPYDLILPNARDVAKAPPSTRSQTKSYTFGTVFRTSHSGAMPRAIKEVDFDIVSLSARDMALEEAEVIKIIDEIACAFPSLQNAKMSIHINHADLFDLILEFCRIEKSHWTAVTEIVGNLNVGDRTWQKIRAELRGPSFGISSTSLDELNRFDIRGEPDKMVEKLSLLLSSSDLPNDFMARSKSVLDHLASLSIYLKHFNVTHTILIAPLSIHNYKFYKGGVVFQLLYDTKKREVFLTGGRYDELVKEQRPKTLDHFETCHAVGFNLGWEKLWSAMMSHQRMISKKNIKKAEDGALYGRWAQLRCDVLVASFDSRNLKSVGLEIVKEIWDAGICAEMAVPTRSLDELMAYYREDKHNWIIIIRHEHTHFGERVLKVKNTIRKTESDVRGTELVGWLRGEMRERAHYSLTQQRLQLHRGASQGDTEPVNEQFVKVLFAMHKQKKNNRRAVVEAAQAVLRPFMGTFMEGPVAAIEVRDDIFDQIRLTRMNDPESWRSLIQNAPSAERKYLADVQMLISRMAFKADANARNCFIFNFRSGACMPYDFRL